ncbi:MAG: type I DNA topoisomerase [Planctomycetes bacterium]|jgi:DNA topoisomerase-1|nr:type I DNA topoisomerase [Planctomycetota bacterium]
MAKKKTTKKKKTTRRKGSAKSGGSSRGRRQTIRPADAEGKHLVIVESPTKAKTINKYLGDDYVVMASVGHVRDLPKSAPKGAKRADHPVPGVDLENDFEPTYEIMPDSRKTITDLKKVAKKASDVWFATDLDREGEAIAWHLAHALEVPEEHAKRVVFNAITRDEIEHAFAQPRGIEQDRVNAQQARRILDRIVGYQVSPLLWKKVAGGLSAGRVQSVGVRLVVEREREIDAFVPDEYWKITGIFCADPAAAGKLGEAWHTFLDTGPDANPRNVKEKHAWLADHECFAAELTEIDGKPFKPDNRDDALRVARAVGFVLDNAEETEDPKGKGPAKHPCVYHGTVKPGVAETPDFIIRSIETKRTSSRPGPPFITSTMQQAASNRLGFQLQRTMRIAQQLYEGVDLGGARGQTGLITYIRTDSTHLSNDAIGMARGYVGEHHGKDYLPEKPNYFKSSNKSAQEAHEAIRPTDVAITPQSIRGKLSDDQYKLYDLIWRRFVACQMTPAQWDSTTVLINTKPDADRSDAAGSAVFKATGRTLVFDGFLKVMGLPKEGDAILPPLEENKPVGPVDLTPTQHFTNPPPRYTEASLQKKMEAEGIGRPSTYASIIQNIQDRKYVETLSPRDRRLRATDLGCVVTDMLSQAFPDVMGIGFTSEMETELDEVEEGGRQWRQMLHEFYDRFKPRVDAAFDTLSHAKAISEPAPHTCPRCGSVTEYKFGRNGRFLSCTAFNVPPVEVEPEGVDAPESGGKWLLYKAKGKARPKIVSEDGSEKVGWTKLTKTDKEKFQKLSDQMPEPCTYAAPIDKDGNPMEPELTDILCPEDGQPMIRRKGRFGPFLASSNYPEVQYILKLDPKKGHVVLPKPPPMETDIPCPKCGESSEANLLLRDSKRGLWLSCSRYPKCRGRESFNKLDEAKQKELEKAWAQHVHDNPVPDIRTTSGHVITEDEEYHPIIAGDDTSGSPDDSTAGTIAIPDTDAA